MESALLKPFRNVGRFTFLAREPPKKTPPLSLSAIKAMTSIDWLLGVVLVARLKDPIATRKTRLPCCVTKKLIRPSERTSRE